MLQRIAIALGAVLALWAGLPAESRAQNFGCACVQNHTERQIKFRYHFGNDPWINIVLPGGGQQPVCWDYGGGPPTSPPLQFQIDVDMTAGRAWTTYALTRVQSVAQDCNRIHRNAHFAIQFRPGTNNAFVHLVKLAAAPPTSPPPGSPPAANSDIPGTVWSVIEVGEWFGTWTRRGNTNVFDAVWRHRTQPGEWRDVLTVESVQGNRIVIFRQGMNGRYRATMSADRKSISGTATWYPSGEFWTGQIR